jgi:PAS domain S-box-containing protein
MKLDSNHSEDYIFTSDLTYISPNERYTYRFNYLGDGVFSLISKGSLDDKTFKNQLADGDKARERLKVLHPRKKYHLLWDVTEVKRGSIIARYMAVSKLKTDSQFGSLTFVGANNFIRNFGLIASKLVPNVKLFFFKTFEEAIQNLEENLKKHVNFERSRDIHIPSNASYYSRFIDLWQNNPNFIRFSGEQYKITTNSKWQHTAKDSSFHIKASVIEGNIIFFECEGYLKPLSVDATYGILENIIEEMDFNSSDNKYYTILNINKIKGVSLVARRRISNYENLYKDRSYKVVMVANPTLLFLLRLLKKINLDNFFHWDSTDSNETAFTKILIHHKGHPNVTIETQSSSYQEEKLEIPATQAEMIKLIRKQHEELSEFKNNQYNHVQKITEIIGRMTWDESFEIPNLPLEDKNQFSEIYTSLAILFQDFKEIIQEKQLHTQKLIESEDKYRNLINLANDVIIVYQDDRVRFLNSRVEQSLGYKPEEIIGRSMDNLVAPEEILRLRDYHIRRIKGDEIPWIYETVFLHSDGHRVPVSMSVGLILYENKLAALVIARDISQKKKNEEELERYRNHLEDIIKQRTLQLQKEISERKVAEESDRLKTTFLSNMSHEIRTPMNAIISFSNFLKEPDVTAEQRTEYLDYIISSGQSLLNLINDIIDISKIEAKQLSINEVYCNINAILEELHKLFEETRKSAEKNNISIIVSIPDKEKNITLHTDPYRLKQILSNLLDNALKFTDVGSITFGYELSDDSILLFVIDTGIGIPDDKKGYVFKRFGKIENIDKNLSGTGLGLAISKHLSLLLNGELWVESKIGEGSSFYLKLPYSNTVASKVEPAIPSYSSGYYSWNNKKILIAEDEDLNFKVMQITLRKTKIEIIRAYNGKEALEITHHNPNIDLILMDIQMPVMDGYEAMRLIKKMKPKLPIIAQTAFALLEEQNHCIEKGFDDYISKPIKPEELLRKIEKQFSTR